MKENMSKNLEQEFKDLATKNGMEIIEGIDLEPFKKAVQPMYKKYEEKFGDIHKIIAETE